MKKSEQTQRGAKIFGNSMSKELTSFVEDSQPEIKAQRLLYMFMAGNSLPIDFMDMIETIDEEIGLV